MANKIFAVQTKDTVISTGLMTETYGDQAPTGRFNTASFAQNQNLTAICTAVTTAINGISTGDQLLVIVPNVAYKSLLKVFIDAAYRNAANGAKAVTALTPAQQKAFDADYKAALAAFGDAVIAKRGQVRLANSMNLYRFQLMPTSDAELLTTGQKITFTKVTENGKDYAVANGWRVLGNEMLPNCEHTVEVRKNTKGTDEYYVTRMMNIGNGEYTTVVDALRRFRTGEFMPEHDSQVRLINQAMLCTIVSSRLPKVAVVDKNFGKASA